jgi:hypothetical protein
MQEDNYNYYDWEGRPARARKTSHEIDLPLAEAYFSGRGFLPIRLVEISLNSMPISKTKFQSMVIKAAKKHRH